MNFGSFFFIDLFFMFFYFEIINEVKLVYWILLDIIFDKFLVEYFIEKVYELFINFLFIKRIFSCFVNFFDCFVFLNLMYSNVKGFIYEI